MFDLTRDEVVTPPGVRFRDANQRQIVRFAARPRYQRTLAADEAKKARPEPASVTFEVEANTKALSELPAFSQRSRIFSISRLLSVR